MVKFSGWRSYTTRVLDLLHCMLRWVARCLLESEQMQKSQGMSSLCMIGRALQAQTIGHDRESVHTRLVPYCGPTWLSPGENADAERLLVSQSNSYSLLREAEQGLKTVQIPITV